MKLKLKKVLCAALAMTCMLAMTACETKKSETDSASSDDSSKKKTLVMATNAEFPPYEFYEGGEVVGIDAEFAAAIAEKLGMELKIEDMAFESVVASVESGKADFGAAGLTITEERKQQVDFSDTYYTGRQVIIVAEDSDIAGPNDLEGKKIGVQLGTTGDLFATDDFGDDSVERYNKGFEAVQAVLQGKIDAVIIDDQPAQTFVSENAGLKIVEAVYAEEDYALCFKKGSELTAQVNDAIAELKEDGTFDEIIAKYITTGE